MNTPHIVTDAGGTFLAGPADFHPEERPVADARYGRRTPGHRRRYRTAACQP